MKGDPPPPHSIYISGAQMVPSKSNATNLGKFFEIFYIQKYSEIIFISDLCLLTKIKQKKFNLKSIILKIFCFKFL